MRARIVPAAGGARWLAEGFRLFRAAPFGWIALTSAYLLGVGMLTYRFPVAGLAVVTALMPLCSMVFMTFARAVGRRAPAPLLSLTEQFEPNWLAQSVLGLIYLACAAAIVLLTAIDLGPVPSAEQPRAEDLAQRLVWLSALYAPVMMMFWFAPALAAWNAVGVAKALVFSVLAFLMNWRAFLAYGAVAGAAVLALAAAAVLLTGALSSKLPPESLVLPLFIVVFPILSGSYYASYRDIFEAEEKGVFAEQA